MNGVFQHPLRVTGRLIWLAGELLLAALNYAIRCVGCPHDSLPLARAGWLQSSSRRVLRVFRLEAKTTGNVPVSGLLVCNHLSYLDILVLAALAPCIFVAKHEVEQWPVFGWFAKLAGTVFVHREQRAQTGRTVRRIDAVLRTGALLVLFPEGTSSGGQTVLPFKSSLLEPATRQPHSLTAGFLSYQLADGNVSEEVCYWKDMTLVPNLVNLCSKRSVQASVHFNQLREGSTDRKQLARELHAEVQRMKHAVAI
jgi:1-acyl-sn-glycerol-3-phosphate acyltransferase